MIKTRWFMLALLLLLVGLLSFKVRDLALNMTFPLGNDEAQYVGAARDYLEEGSFKENTHRLTLPHFVPLGYPALVALAARATGFPLPRAAMAVNLVAGTLLPMLLCLVVWRMGGGWPGSLVAGALAAINWWLVLLSAQAMTDTLYMLLVLMMCWLVWESLQERWRGRLVALCAALGLLFGAAYQVRVSALALLPAIPLLYLGYQWRRRWWSRHTLVWALGMFLGLAVLVIGLTSYRLYRLNGYFSISPQIAGNLSIGEFLSGNGHELMRLDSTGRFIVRRIQQRQGADVLGSILGNPGAWLKRFANNLARNTTYLWEGLWPGVKGVNCLFLLLLFTIMILALFLPQGLYNAVLSYLILQDPSMPPRKTLNVSAREFSLSPFRDVMVVTAVFALAHILFYSAGVYWRRYMIQQVPLLLVMMSVPAGKAIARLAGGVQLLQKSRGTLVVRFQLVPLLMLAALSTSLGVGGWSNYNATWSQVVARDKPQPPSLSQAHGRMIASLSKGGTHPRIVCDNWAVPYYARGLGVEISYLESDPQRLLTYLRYHRVEYVSANLINGFADTWYFGVPLVTLMDALSRIPHAPVTVLSPRPSSPDRPLYHILRPIRLQRVGRLAQLPPQGLPLAPGRRYLVFAVFPSSQERIKRFLLGYYKTEYGPGVRETLALAWKGTDLFQVADGGGRHELPGTLVAEPLELSYLAAGHSRDDKVRYYQYVAFSTEGMATPRLLPSPAPLPPVLEDRGPVTIYEIVPARPLESAGAGKVGNDLSQAQGVAH